MPDRTTDADIIQWFEVHTGWDEDEAVVPTALLRKLIALAKLAKRPGGRPPMSGRDLIRKSVIIGAARGKRTRLIEKERVPRDQANRLILREVTPKLEAWAGRKLARETILDWLSRRRDR
jgi:hypothetical protein